jgi:chondroitin sulfate synthase
LDLVLNSVNRSDVWDQFTGGRFYSEPVTIHKISSPWVEAISVGARESAKMIYKQMKLTGRITRIQVPEVYHKISETGSELIGTIIIRHSGVDTSGRAINQNVNSRMRMRKPFLERPFMLEKTKLDFDRIEACIRGQVRGQGQTCTHPIDQIPITIVIPLTGRSDAMHRFLSIFENLVKNEKENLNLVIVDFPHGTGEDQTNLFIKLKSDLSILEKKLPDTRIELLKEEGEFSRGKGLQIGAESQGQNELLFFCDIDMVYDASTMKKIRHQTIQVIIKYFL